VIVACRAFALSASPSVYVDSAQCALCHSKIAASYGKTGMGRAFSYAFPDRGVTDFYHEASDTYFAMRSRGGHYFQRRWQIGFDGRETNVEEREAVYVLGSGNHARTWLSRSATGKLIELPLGWYAEKGGYWGLNPGYDSPHPPAQRTVTDECMFCHNAYPRVAGQWPEGIDCQRCHGPGAKHVDSARRPGVTAAELRNTIVNPARLSPERGMEVCMQCHLETASTRLPSLVRRFRRGPFSYVAGQPLGDFVISFDHAPGTGYDDKFEIAGAAYRLRQARCFLASKGRLTCTACHDPHDIPRGLEAERHYANLCRGCHESRDQLHATAVNCTGCHMPKRRTEDAVHVVMTDHRIARRLPAGDLLAPIAEKHPDSSQEYRGEVVSYYPAGLDDPLYIAVAQVLHGSNLSAGIRQLSALLATAKHPIPDFYVALGDAWRLAGNPVEAADAYRKGSAWRQEGAAVREAGDLSRSADLLKRAVRASSGDARGYLELGLTLSKMGRASDAIETLKKSIQLDPDNAEAWNVLGLNQGMGGAEALRHALQRDPYYAPAHSNLAKLLAAGEARAEAFYHFEKAARLQPADAANRYEYALTLVQSNRFDESQAQVEAAVQADPNLAEAHELLGGLLSRKHDQNAALREYEEAVRLKPDFGRAQLDLALTLAAAGDMTRATKHLREAAKSPDPRVSEPALRALRRSEQPPR
jgi:predicted CXXCH cytochrome family protein